MLSTSILSRPIGPNELLTMFATDCAAMTIHGTMSEFKKRDRFSNHFDRGCPAQRRDPPQGTHQLSDRVGTFSKGQRKRRPIQVRELEAFWLIWNASSLLTNSALCKGILLLNAKVGTSNRWLGRSSNNTSGCNMINIHPIGLNKGKGKHMAKKEPAQRCRFQIRMEGFAKKKDSEI